MPSNDNKLLRQTGFSLVEIMVGMVIGLLATLVIMQVFSVFEGQKRSTTGNADAQTNGSIALYSIQREALMAGFGLTAFDALNSPMQCTAFTPAGDDVSPVTITDGGAAAGASDSVTIRYGATQQGGVPIRINGVTITAAPAGTAGVDNNLGCRVGDVAMIVNGTSCVRTTVTGPTYIAVPPSGPPDTTHIELASVAGVSVGANLACMGGWGPVEFEVDNNQLERNNVPIQSDIVNIQAQYGISAAPNSNQITQWVNATGAQWGAAPLAVADRNRIKSIRIAVVARNGLWEKDVVTTPCSSLTAASPTGLCAWEGSATSPAPAIDLSNTADWDHYRYRVFETIIPLRNIVWAKDVL